MSANTAAVYHQCQRGTIASLTRTKSQANLGPALRVRVMAMLRVLWIIGVLAVSSVSGALTPAASHSFDPTEPLINLRANAAPALPQADSIAGVVFRDLNFNGQRDVNEPGIGGVQIGAYSDAGLVASVTSNADGTYAFQPAVVIAPVRLELTNVPVGYYPSHFYSTSGQSEGLVRFVQALPATANFALSTPTDFCAANPGVASNCFVFGNPIAGTYQLSPTLYSFPYESGTTSSSSNANVRNPTTHSLAVPANAVGSTWALAYQRESGTLFAAAFAKRHAGFGPAGTGGIYAVNAANGSTSVLVNLNTLFPGSTGPDSHDQADYFLDNSAWDSVGKSALGGMDVSIDGETLWVMNLYDRRLYRLPVGVPAVAPTAAQVVSYTLPTPAAGPTGCVAHPQTGPGELNRNLRPFAVKATATSEAGYVYIGMVCTAESSNLATDLRAFVYQLDVATGVFAQVANFPLNYPRGCASQNNTGECGTAAWMPWVTVQTVKQFYPYDEYFYPQPMFSDIEFDDAGNMIVSLGDRFGHETSEQRPSLGGAQSLDGAPAGDVLKLGRNADGTWTIEQNGQAGGLTTQGQNSNQGPGGGEFYWQDNFPVGSANTGQHQEITAGGLAVMPGSGEVMASAYNPTPLYQDVDGRTVFRTTGPVWFNNTTGARSRSYLLTEYELEGYFTKATGMGDLELMCNAAPVEVGSRVWFDTNGNGIQDPSEPPMAGLTVRLYDLANSAIATTTTDTNGRYFFSTAGQDRILGTADDLTARGFSASTVRQVNTYTVRLDNPDNYGPGGPLEGLTPAMPNVNSGPNSAARNSKASIVNGYPAITFSTGRSGQNNDTYDFGMAVPGQLSGRVWIDANYDGLRDLTDSGVPNSLVTVLGTNASSLMVTTTTNAAGEYSFAQLPPGNVLIQFTVPQGYTFTYPLVSDVTRDSDVIDFANRRTGVVTVPLGLAQMNADAGFWKPSPKVRIQTFTNGDPADALPGPSIPFNSPVSWGYSITNTGDITLTDISVIDDRLGTIACPVLTLAPGQAMGCARSNLALGGQYTNVATVYSLDGVTTGQITDTDTSHYYGTVLATLQVKALTNGEDADAAPGPVLPNTSPVNWTYLITNTGAVTLSNVILNDNRLGAITCPKTTLLAGEGMSCLRSGKAFSGVYENRATVTGAFNVPNLRGAVSAVDFSHYQGVPGAIVRGTAWFDVNANGRFDAGEPPMAGVQVTLYLAANSSVAAAVATTDFSGVYIFNQLLPGNYIVGVQPPAGYRFTTPLIGDIGIDSDIDPATGLTRILALGAGQIMNGVNAGMLAQSAGLSVRVLTNFQPSSYTPGPLLEAGTPITWSYLIYNTGNFTLTQIQVVDSVQGPITCSPSPLGPGAPLVCEKYGIVGLGVYNSSVLVSGSYVSLVPDLNGEHAAAAPNAVITATDQAHYVGGRADLAIYKSAIPNPALSGVAVELNGTVTYTLLITNVGTYTATQIVISDELPAGMAFQTSLGDSVATPTLAGQGQTNVLNWAIPALGPGQNLKVAFTSKALSSPANGQTTYVNVGYVASKQTPSVRSNVISHALRPTAVSVARFTASWEANGVLLEWRTSVELNTFGFVLHRSANNLFEQASNLGRLIPATNTTGGDYAYFDSSADALVSFYWIEEVTTDGIPGMVFGPISARTDSSAPAVIVPGANTAPAANSAAAIGGGVAVQPVPVVPPSNTGAGNDAGSVLGNPPAQSPQVTEAVNTAAAGNDQGAAPADSLVVAVPTTVPAATSAAAILASNVQPANDLAVPENNASQPMIVPTVPVGQKEVASGIQAQPTEPSHESSVQSVEVASGQPSVASDTPTSPRSSGNTLLFIGLALFAVLLVAGSAILVLIARSVRR